MTKTYALKDLEDILRVKERALFRDLKEGRLECSKRGKRLSAGEDILDFPAAGRRRSKA